MVRYWRVFVFLFAVSMPPGALAQEAEAPPGIAGSAQGERLTFPVLDSLATDYETSLETVAREDSRDTTRLMIDASRATAQGDTGAALAAMESMVGRQGDAAGFWMQLAQVWHERDGGNARRLAAAYIAYRRARPGDDTTRALLALGDAAFARQKALGAEADRAARLVEQDEENAEAAARLLVLDAEADGMLSIARMVQSEIGRTLSRGDEIARRGLRTDATPGFYLGSIEPGGVEWRGAAPRSSACALFTRPVQADAGAVAGSVALSLGGDGEDGEPVAVAPGDIIIDGYSVCLHGLAVDTAYALRFDKTLRSAGGARLPLDLAAPGGVEARWAATTFRTAAPEPRIGFEGDDYVLRSGGYATLGAVNMRSATLSLYRIADRSLARNVALGQFGRRLDSREVTAFDDGVSELVWSGMVAFDDARNRRALERIPLDAILDARRQAVADPDASREVFGGRLHVDPIREAVAETGLFALVVKEARNAQGEARVFFKRTETGAALAQGADAIPTQWFVRTDMGLSFYESAASLHVVARDLGTGAAVKGAFVELISASNRVLSSRATDAQGIATFRRALTKGTGALKMRMATARRGADFVFLPADTAPLQLDGLGLARHGIDTRHDLYLTPERGVYRPGETIEAVAILRGRAGEAVAAPPTISLRLEDDGGLVGAVRMLAPGDWRAGGRGVSIPVPETATAGTARLVAREGVDGPIIGQARIVIGFFRPDTVRVETGDAPFEASVSGKGDARMLRIEGGVRASYLYGVPLAERGGLPEAPANGLAGTVWARLVSDGTHAPECYPGFAFGDTARTILPALRRAETIRTTGQEAAPGEGQDGQGYLRILADFIDPPLDRAPLRAEVTVQLDDGAANQGRTTAPIPVTVPRTGPMIGLRARGGGVQALVLDPDDTAREASVYYRIETEDITYIWQRDAGAWKAQATARLATLGLTYDGAIAYADGAPALFGADDATSDLSDIGAFDYRPRGADAAGCRPLGEMLDTAALPPGRYIVTAALDAGFAGGAGSALATYRFEVGQSEGPAPERPETFSLRLERGDVAVGDEIVAHVEALSIGEGHVLVAAVKDGDILAWRDVVIAQGRSDPIRFETADTGRDWRGGVHLFATAFRAQGAGRAPHAARAVAATHLRVAGARRSFDVAILSPDPRSRVQTTPGDTALGIRVRADGLEGGEVAYAAIGLIDDGLWRLTGFSPRDPDAHFFAKRSLALRVRDLYGRMLGSASLRGSGASGGDIPGMAASGLLAGGLLSRMEIVEFRDGIATTEFDLDGFVGAANLVVIAWSEGAQEPRTGFARAAYYIQSDAIASLVAPERLSPGDRATARLVVRRPKDDPRMSAALRMKMRIGRPGARSSAEETRIDREIVLVDGEWSGTVPLDATLLRDPALPVSFPVRLELYDPASPDFPIVRKDWSIAVGPPPGESVEFLAALGIADPGGELEIDLSAQGAEGAVTLREIVLNPLAPTLAITQAAWEAPRDFPMAAADAVFGIADLIARRPPRLADGGLGALIALRGDERAVPEAAVSGIAPRMGMRGIWQAASALDIALALREMGAMDDAAVIDRAVGELTHSLRLYDVPEFCDPKIYFAIIALAKAGDLDPSLPLKLERCLADGPPRTDAFHGGLLAAALSATGSDGSGNVLGQALEMLAGESRDRNAPRDLAMVAAMVVESGADRAQAAQFVRAALAPGEERAQVGREAAAWMARTQARLAALFEPMPIDLDALALAPRGLDAEARTDGTVSIDLAARGGLERLAFGNGTDLPIYATGRYRLSPGDLTEEGGNFDVLTNLLRDTGEDFEATDALEVRERGVFVVEASLPPNMGTRMRAIVHVPPGMELAAMPYSRRMIDALDLYGVVEEVIHEPGRVVLRLASEGSAGNIRIALAVTPVLVGDFTWPATILTHKGDLAGWSAAFRVAVGADARE